MCSWLVALRKKRMNKKLIFGAVFILAGCSSPPPPPPVDWKGNQEILNTGLPAWKENNILIPSLSVSGRWSNIIRDFSPHTPYTADIYYSVLHSPFVMVATTSSESFFSTKSWLRQHGAKGVIRYQAKVDCLNCNSTDIYLSR